MKFAVLHLCGLTVELIAVCTQAQLSTSVCGALVCLSGAVSMFPVQA